MTTQLFCGDCLDVMPMLAENSVDTVITDPPYGLSKQPDIAEVMQAWIDDKPYSHNGSGFMGKSWDSFVPGPRYWKEVYRVLKPGGMALVFAGTRTADLMSIALRFAGFEIRDTLMWIYGAGFPKSHNISKAIDKAAGVERCTEWYDRYRDGKTRENQGNQHMAHNAMASPLANGNIQSMPATEQAKLWDGWGTGLKPAWEPIILAMKPIDSTFANNALVHGVAGLWIDGSRIATSENESQNGKDPLPLTFDTVSFDTPESCRDWLLRIRAALMLGNNGGKAQAHDAGDLDDNLPLDALCEMLAIRLYPNGAWCGLNLNEVLGSQFCYPPDLRLYDALVQMLQEAAQDGTPSLAGALERISRFQSEPLHIHGLDIDRLSSCDVFPYVQPLCYLLKKLYTCLKYTPQTRKSQGRFPSNLILSHHFKCVKVGMRRVKGDKRDGRITATPARSWKNSSIKGIARQGHADADGFEFVSAYDCHPQCPIRLLGEQSGILKSGGREPGTNTGTVSYKLTTQVRTGTFESSTGSAARYFLNLDGETRFFYAAKASRRERNEGLEEMEKQYLATMGDGIGGREHNPDEPNAWAQNNHPTVKPLKLMEYLCILTRTPTGGVVLDPFMGSGSTGVACVNTGRDFIGIERDAEYYTIAKRRIEHAQQQACQLELML